MIRSAIINIETELNQEEFEIWLLKTLKQISVNPETTSIEPFIPEY